MDHDENDPDCWCSDCCQVCACCGGPESACRYIGRQNAEDAAYERFEGDRDDRGAR